MLCEIFSYESDFSLQRAILLVIPPGFRRSLSKIKEGHWRPNFFWVVARKVYHSSQHRRFTRSILFLPCEYWPVNGLAFNRELTTSRHLQTLKAMR
jgi:hypothetical protein